MRAEDGVDVAKDDMEIVSALRTALADKVGKDRFELWFGTNMQLEFDGATLTIGARSQFLQDWLRRNFRTHIESACLATLGRCPDLRFRIDESSSTELVSPVVAPRTSPPASQPRPLTLCTISTDEASAQTPSVQPVQKSTRRSFADLNSFVTGRSNRLARTVAETVIEQPGRMSPLLVHGPTGVGKTHLLEGIWTAARKRRGMTAIYLSAEQFTSSFLQALRGSGLPSFRQKYRGVELLILDDLQFLCGKRCTQVELLYTMNTLLREGRQLVLAADRPLSELEDLGPEMLSRLSGGMVCEIEPPDYETRVAILQQMAHRFELALPHEVQRFVASQLTSHARELSGALCRLQATSQASGRPVDLAMAEGALAEMIRHSSRLVRLPDIEKAICGTFGLEPSSLQSTRKTKGVSQPRMLAMWLARKYTRAALSEIGHYFGRRSHSTVVSAQKRVEDWLAAGTSLQMASRTWRIDDAIHQIEQSLLAG